jgi:hypothetical protein
MYRGYHWLSLLRPGIEDNVEPVQVEGYDEVHCESQCSLQKHEADLRAGAWLRALPPKQTKKVEIGWTPEVSSS